jgi:pimeloyl-ACP methyl ester carboxylesterase/DNA-binding CsgD family transcriptional regulator
MRARTEQEIRFCSVGGARVALAVTGEGPPLVLPAWLVGHVEAGWRDERFRAFVLALARGHTVVRYDRLGTGLSDRERPPEGMTLDCELRTLEAVVDDLGFERLDLFGLSYGGCLAAAYAGRHPGRVGRIVVFGAFARGADLAPAAVRESLAATVRAHPALGSRVLADVWLPGAAAAERQELADQVRAAAEPGTAAALLELAYRADARDAFARLAAPTLVLHRRGDRAAPFARGRELAALIPGARLVALDGDAHPPWHGDVASVVEPALAFLAADAPPPPKAPPRPARPAAPPPPDVALSAREREILRLVAGGLSDARIAETLYLSPHTVHRHMANIRAKLRQPTRAAAAAAAAREGLI